MSIWVKTKEVVETGIDLVKAIINTFKKIASLSPIEYFKTLTDTTDPQSAHNFINLLWGCGSFLFFWGSYFVKIYKNPSYTLNAMDYGFIVAMAGISTMSANIANRSTTPITPVTTTTTTTTTPAQTVSNTSNVVSNQVTAANTTKPSEAKQETETYD